MAKVEYNPIYSHVFESKARVLNLFGGRDSGKSFFIGGQYIPIMMNNEKYFRGVVIRKTYASLKDSVYQEIKDGMEQIGISSYFEYNVSPLEIRHKNGNKLIFRGLDDMLKIKSLKGINFIWVEEAEDLSRKEFDDLLIILRGEGYQRIILTHNPSDEEHFTNHDYVLTPPTKLIETFEDGDKKVWINKQTEEIDGEKVSYDVLSVCSTYDDNLFVPAVRKAVIEKLKHTDPYLYEVYRKGRYATRGGRILTNWEIINFTDIHFENFDNKGYAQDFGFNHANAILSVAEKDNNLFVFDEIYEYEKDKTELVEICDNKGLDKSLRMICDSAEPASIKTFKNAGYKAEEVKKYAGSVKAQIDKLKSYDKIYINSKCVNTIKEIKSWQWKQNKNGKYTDEPLDIFDDAMAALRYSTDLFGKKKLKALNRL